MRRGLGIGNTTWSSTHRFTAHEGKRRGQYAKVKIESAQLIVEGAGIFGGKRLKERFYLCVLLPCSSLSQKENLGERSLDEFENEKPQESLYSGCAFDGTFFRLRCRRVTNGIDGMRGRWNDGGPSKAEP